MATNSTYRIQKLVDGAARRADLAPALAVAGHSDQPALDIATEVMNEMIRGGPDGQRMNWKWNRSNVMPAPYAGTVLGSHGVQGTFLTNVFQQDYAVPGVISCDWLEEATYVNINQLNQPKQVLWAEVKRNLSKEYIYGGGASGAWKICFLPNALLDYGIWGQSAQFNVNGLTCPGPGVVYGQPLGPGVAPNNPTTQILDPATGNLYVLTTYGTCGGTAPTFPGTVTFPTLAAPNTAATTVPDGSCVWTALNPNGFGFRLSFPPAGNAVVWLFRVTAQLIPPVYTSLNQTLGILPDDMLPFFRQGFEAKCRRRSIALGPNAGKALALQQAAQEEAMWLKRLQMAVQAGNREQEDQVLVPDGVAFGGGPSAPTAAYPFMGSWGGW